MLSRSDAVKVAKASESVGAIDICRKVVEAVDTRLIFASAVDGQDQGSSRVYGHSASLPVLGINRAFDDHSCSIAAWAANSSLHSNFERRFYSAEIRIHG